jgi:hypothetical protein
MEEDFTGQGLTQGAGALLLREADAAAGGRWRPAVLDPNSPPAALGVGPRRRSFDPSALLEKDLSWLRLLVRLPRSFDLFSFTLSSLSTLNDTALSLREIVFFEA